MIPLFLMGPPGTLGVFGLHFEHHLVKIQVDVIIWEGEGELVCSLAPTIISKKPSQLRSLYPPLLLPVLAPA